MENASGRESSPVPGKPSWSSAQFQREFVLVRMIGFRLFTFWIRSQFLSPEAKTFASKTK